MHIILRPRLLGETGRLVLSALLVLTAFFIPNPFGFLILVAWVPLAFWGRATFVGGFVWGLLVFGGHFIWLLTFLTEKTPACWWLACLLYLAIVGYFSLTTGLWFWVDGQVQRRWPGGWRRLVGWWTVAGLYYWFFSGYSLWIFFRREGYPFLHPGIPLARFSFFLWFVAKIGLVWQGMLGYWPVQITKPATINFVYCPPVDLKNQAQQTPVGLGQAVYHRLTSLVLPDADRQPGTTVIVAPETFYPASLNLHPEQSRLWCGGLPQSGHLIFGSQATVGQKYYQTAYWIHDGLIKKYYVKKHQVPFAEKIPRGWRKLPLIKETFLKNNEQFSKDRRSVEEALFEITPEVVFLPQLCSEFFFKTPAEKIWAGRQKAAGRNFFIIFLVNDSWFMKYFKRLLQDLTAIKAAFLGAPVVYVGHAGLKKF